jgi:hypothetical protein
VFPDEFTKAQAIPRQQGSQAAGAGRDRISSAYPTAGKPQAQTPQAQATRFADFR